MNISHLHTTGPSHAAPNYVTELFLGAKSVKTWLIDDLSE